MGKDDRALAADLVWWGMEESGMVHPMSEPWTVWQLIETAPRDTYKVAGPTLILGHSHHKWIRFGKWYVQEGCWYYSGTSERSQYAQVKGDAPTHWMPMPAFPDETDGLMPG